MDKLDFVEGIKILSSCYQKVISNVIFQYGMKCYRI